MKKLIISLVFFLSLFDLIKAENNKLTSIQMASTNGDIVGRNKIYKFDDMNGYLEISSIKTALSTQPIGFSVIFYDRNGEPWIFKFVVPAKQTIVKGKIYRETESYPYHSISNPGMKVCRISEDYADLTGEFTIIDYSVDESGEVQSLAIDFKQTAGEDGELKGKIRYRYVTRGEIPDKIQPEIPYETRFEFIYKTPGKYDFHFLAGREISSLRAPQVGKDLVIDYTFDDFDFELWVLFGLGDSSIQLKPGIYFGAKSDVNAEKRLIFLHSQINPKDPLSASSGYGNFEILQIERSQGIITSLAVDYIYYEDEAKPPLSILGMIRYNSHIPISTKETIIKRLQN